jgi:DNA repair protein RadC
MRFGIVPRYTIRLVKEANFKIEYKKIESSNDAYFNLAPFFEDADREYMAVLLLDTKHKVIGFQEVSRGTIDAASVFPREVVKLAILTNSAAIILAHNHPSGDYTPSKEDNEITKTVKDACKLLDVRLLDHLILGEKDYYSYLDNRLI